VISKCRTWGRVQAREVMERGGEKEGGSRETAQKGAAIL
jgi:hypothetical protein